MKKFLALVLALLMALSCFSFAGAETVCQHEKKAGDQGTLVTPATCTTPAVYKYTCDRCGKEFTLEEGPVSNHQGGKATKVTPANCEHGTITDYDECTVCKKPYSVEANDKLNHDYEDVKDSAVAATCTTPATKQVKCKNCGETKTVETAPATGHKFSDELADVNIPATCTTPGATGSAYYCVNGCGAYDTTRDYTLVEIPALTHTKDDGDEFNAFINHFFTTKDGELTGVAEGLTVEEGKKTVPATGISTVYGVEKGFEVDYKAVTCTEDGHLTVTCLDCGKSWTANIKAAGHKYDLAIVHFVDGTGKANQKEFTLVEGKTLKQQWEEFVDSITDPSFAKMVEDCTDTLNVEYKCINCDATINGEGFACTHDFENGRVIEYKQQKYGEQKVSTYYNESDIVKCQPYTVVKQCKHCTVTTEIAVEAEKHNMQQYKELTDEEKKAQIFEEPTCTKEGSVLLKCKNDGCTYTVLQSIAKVGHVADPEKTEIVAATCTKAGTRTFTCKDCGYKWTEVIPAMGHNYVVTKDEPGTCTKAAVKVETCKYCGDTKTTTGSLGHTLKDRADIKVEYNGKLQLQDGAKEYTVLGVKWDDCAKEGRVQFICGKCCELITIENKAGTAHEWSLAKGNVDYPGTVYEGYTAEGYKVKDVVKVDEEHCKVVIEGLYTCANCNKTEKREFSIEIKHEPVKEDGKAVVIIETGKEPTCTKAGEGYYKCEHCGKLYKGTVEAKLHDYVTTWDGEKWVYTCSLCGDVKTLDYTAEKYVITLDNVTFGARTEGYATVALENSLTPAGIFGTRYAYIRWTWTGANNEKWVAEDTRAIVDGKVDMKGMKAPVGTTLTEVLVIVTGEKNADSMQLGDFSNYGYVIK